ncbi:MAG: carbohydrate kinase family protein [Anaerolineae bacterium]
MTTPLSLDVVGLGYCAWDYLGIVEHIPEFDSPTANLADFAASGGGPVATALVTLARLGAQTGFIGAVGDDEPGLRCKQAFEQEGVSLQRMRIQLGARTPICMILVQADSGRRVIFCYRGTCHQIALQPEDYSYISTARFLHLDGHHIGAAIQAAQCMHEAGGTVVLDANRPRPHLDELLPWVDVLITNAYFLSAYTGQQNLDQAAQLLLQNGVRIVVTTLGERGCKCFTSEGQSYLPGFSVPIVDTTGAGDAFHGAFIYGLLHDWPLEQTASFANAVAALNCTALGGRAALPRLEQVFAFLQSTGRWDETMTFRR